MDEMLLPGERKPQYSWSNADNVPLLKGSWVMYVGYTKVHVPN